MNKPQRSLRERLRSSVRSALPRGIYATLSHSLDWACALRKLGWQQCRRLWRMHPRHCGQPGSEPLRFEAPNLSHPFYIRPGTSDVNEFIYSVVRESYGSKLPHYEPIFIFDAGANIGDTAAWMLSRFGKATLIAVEPEASNFDLLLRNCSPYGERLIPVQAAVWPAVARLSLRTGSGKDAVQVCDAGDGDCPAVTIPELMDLYSFPRLDILKCDIEGAELELFSADADRWLSRTGFLVVETHGEKCLQAVLSATSRIGFTHRAFRNLHIFARQNWVC